MDAFNNVTEYTLGVNSIDVFKEYDEITGYLREHYAGQGVIQEHHFRYDQLGNVRYRSDKSGSTSLVERFTYDSLNRLNDVFLNGLLTQSTRYYANGNIKTKSDVNSGSTYQYGTQQSNCSNDAGAHAVVAIGSSLKYCYDTRGNQTKAYINNTLDRDIVYSLYDKPLSIWSANGTSSFNYDANKNMYKRIDTTNGVTKTTYYVGGSEIIYETNGSYETRRYIQDFAIHSIKSSGLESFHYVFKDHLGSGSVFTDENGNVLQRASFDAFGKRRNATNWNGMSDPYSQLTNLTNLTTITQKGFTDHEQVDHASIVHMGGRIYDPNIGRFVQPDPIVQDARDAQSLNRYSYVYNNPLSYTDPTGYSCDPFDEARGSCPSSMDGRNDDQKATAAKRPRETVDSNSVQNHNVGENINSAGLVMADNGKIVCTRCGDIALQLDIEMPELITKYWRDVRDGDSTYPDTVYIGIKEAFHSGIYKSESEIDDIVDFNIYLNENPRITYGLSLDLPNISGQKIQTPKLLISPSYTVDVYNENIKLANELTNTFRVNITREKQMNSQYSPKYNETLVTLRWEYTIKTKLIDRKVHSTLDRNRGSLSQPQSWPITPR